MDNADVPLGDFGQIFPLPFRLQFNLLFGIWMFCLSLYYFHLLNIDFCALVRFAPRPSGDEPHLHVSTFRLALRLTIPWFLGVCFFWRLSLGDPYMVLRSHWVPNLAWFAWLLIMLVLPHFALFHPMLGSSGERHGVARLWTILGRVARGGISVKGDKFGDVLLADAMTSYAKPISEGFVISWMLFTGRYTTDRPDRSCGNGLVVPLALAWPFLIRLRQCVKERQWLNALKYSTMFPVIVLGAMDSSLPFMFYARVLAALVNSSYSLWWDVTRDWDLTLLTPNPHRIPFGLRGRLVYRPVLYYVAIALDFVLRFFWAAKLLLHLEYFDFVEPCIFFLELAEISRRWMWFCFRVETEWVRAGGTLSMELGELK